MRIFRAVSVESLALTIIAQANAEREKNAAKRAFWLSLVGVTGFEPATPASRTQCSTGLSYTPTLTD